MVTMSVLGLNWCRHAGWLVVLYDPESRRRLQVSLAPEDAVVLSGELAQRGSERSGMYGLVGAFLRDQPRFASVNFALAAANRASAALVLHLEPGQTASYPTSTVDGVALAMRVGLPIFVEEALIEACGVQTDPELKCDPRPAAAPTVVPRAFEVALGEAAEEE